MNNIDYKALGQRIRQARESKGFTQEKLAELCDFSASHIGLVERAARIPSLDAIYKISCVLDVSMDYLLLRSDSANGTELTELEAFLQSKDSEKVKRLLRLYGILAENIDKI